MSLTYDPIATTTVSGSSTATITFSSISSAYTDLLLILNGKSTVASQVPTIQFNSDTTTTYSVTYLWGDGTSASSGRATSQTYISPLLINGLSNTIPELATVNIFNYAGSTFKSALMTGSGDRNGSGTVETYVGMWRSTTAINRIDIKASNFADGFTATLYGIKAE